MDWENRLTFNKDTIAKYYVWVEIINSPNTWWRLTAKVAFMQKKIQWFQGSHAKWKSTISCCCEKYKETWKMWTNWRKLGGTKMISGLRNLVWQERWGDLDSIEKTKDARRNNNSSNTFKNEKKKRYKQGIHKHLYYWGFRHDKNRAKRLLPFKHRTY